MLGAKEYKERLREFTKSTQLELERQLVAAQTRAIMAEEQLAALQHYIETATAAYHQEIRRLRRFVSAVQSVARGQGYAREWADSPAIKKLQRG